jgi:uncharacterized membrane protein YphA (DoxX/SURF4 family)
MKNKLAFLAMRVALGIVFLIFGIGKFKNDLWAETIRTMDFFLRLPWDVNISLAFIGIAEMLTGAALIIGLSTRFFAAVAAAQLIGILILLKFQETRDIGLLGMAVYMIFVRDESFSVDYLWKKR